MTHKKITFGPEETIDFAISLAKKLNGGEVLALTGDLGAGKTTFVKGLVEGLKISEVVTSPTFVMLKSYPAKIESKKIEFVHIDAYRAESLDDIKSVGIEDFLGRNDVILAIEWAEKIKEILPQNTIYINFKHLNENRREISTKIAPAKIVEKIQV